MDLPQLKLLAGLVRSLLEEHDVSIGHSKSLDLIAALPGLRNWPEVNTFPERVAACELSLGTAARLAHRMKAAHSYELAPAALIARLAAAPSAATQERRTEIWPSGPRPGVYVTTSGTAIDALLGVYADATDGGLVYAEEAGEHDANAIRLGEAGLWSAGLGRLPSGTLLVVGPVNLTQEEWHSNAQRLQQACELVLAHGLRVAVLVSTPARGQLHDDVRLLVESECATEDLPLALIGTVTEQGALAPTETFAGPRAKALVKRPFSTASRLPSAMEREVRAAIARNPFGIIVFGSNQREPDRLELLEALIPLTEEAGPVARILPNGRTGYNGLPPLSARFAELPVMPSVESAYAQGYRRMLFENCLAFDGDLASYAGDTCFLVGTFSAECDSAFFNAMVTRKYDEIPTLPQLLATIGLGVFETKAGKASVSDLYVRPAAPVPDRYDRDAMCQHIQEGRVLRWEDDLEPLLETRALTSAQVKQASPNHMAVHDYLAARGRRSRAATP